LTVAFGLELEDETLTGCAHFTLGSAAKNLLRGVTLELGQIFLCWDGGVLDFARHGFDLRRKATTVIGRALPGNRIPRRKADRGS
jgi:hypothetical protein